MLTLISAVPGSGKTLYCINEMLKHLKNGRRVYSNINGLKINEVLPLKHDWRDHDNGSVLFIDECHEHPAYSADPVPYEFFIEPAQNLDESDNEYRKRVTKEKAIHTRLKEQYTEQQLDIARSLSLHRHFGFDIYLITQSPDRVRQVVLNLIGMHIHLHRAMGLERSTKYLWRYAQSWPNSKAAKSETESKETFTFNKNHYHLYESSEQHTHKRHIPKQYIIAFGAGFLVLAYSLKMFLGTSFFGLNPLHEPQSVSATSPAQMQNLNQQSQLSQAISGQNPTESKPAQAESERVASVFATDKYCHAYNSFGDLLELQLPECQFFANNPIYLKSGDPALKAERLQAANYQTPMQSGTTSGMNMPPNDGVVSLN